MPQIEAPDAPAIGSAKPMPVGDIVQYAMLGVVAIMLAISNPDHSQFRAYYNQNFGFFERLLCGSQQSSNYFLFSVYDLNCNDTVRQRYLGIAGNFILLDTDTGDH